MGADLDYRKRIYERYGSNFQDASEVFSKQFAMRWGRNYRHYLRGWLPKRKDANILDVACGGGKLLYFFIHAGYSNVSGVDISPEQVKLAQQVTPNVYEANILEWLAEHSAEFDLITGLDIVEHFEKGEVLRFLDLCFGALKPGGRLVLQTPNAESLWGSMHRYNDFTHEVGFNPNLINRLLHLSGYENIVVREQGPIPWGHSFLSSVRYIIWQLIRLGLKIWNLAEIGTLGSGVFTRIMLCSGVKPK